MYITIKGGNNTKGKRTNILFILSFRKPPANLYSTQCLKITQNVAFEFWHFSPIFALLKLTYLVTLFDRKLQFFKNSQIEHFWHF